MIAFIVPFKGKTNSSWEKECHNLNRTLISLTNQTSQHFKVFVIYTDAPDNPFVHEKVVFVKFPFSFMKQAEIDENELRINPSYNGKISDKRYDQGKRIMYGSYLARKNGCEFVMPVDADDFVSCKIAEWVEPNNNKDGWYVNKGYLYRETDRFLVRVNQNMNLINGSTHIIHVQHLPQIPFEEIHPSLMCFFSDHGYLKTRLKQSKNIDIQPLPFYALIYFLHSESWLGLKSFYEDNILKYYIKTLLRGMLITRKLIAEFGFERL
jgi:hypothetical protein